VEVKGFGDTVVRDRSILQSRFRRPPWPVAPPFGRTASVADARWNACVNQALLRAPTPLRDLMNACFQQAEARDFPPFLTGERQSTPVNATPYVVNLSDLVAGRALARRKRFVKELASAVGALKAMGAEGVAALLGGSAIGPKPEPGDLDCALFYRWVEGRAAADSLADLQTSAKARGLDLRLLPVDGDPLLLIKTVSFFSMLYSKNAGERTIVRGLVLVDCLS
jgi:hypothetical protein